MSVETVTPQMGVTMTPEAIEHTRRQLAKRPEAAGIRLAVKKSGCSGYKYDIEWVEAIADDDRVFTPADDLKLVVRNDDLPIVNGTEIDFIKEGLNAMFAFRNPNATAECGCGESFAVS